MNTIGAAVLGASLGLAAGQAQAVVLTFEDVPGGSTQGSVFFMPTYKGFDFNFTLSWIDLVDSGWNFGAHGGEFGLLNNSGGDGVIIEATGADFTFGGLWAKRWATAPESGGAPSLFGTIEGWNDGVQVWSTGTALNGSYTYYGAQSGAIDELRLNLGNYFLVDDIYLNESGDPSEVPLPAAAPLMALGLAGLGWAGRRRA